MQKLEVLKFIQYGLLESDSVWRPYELHNEEKTYNEVKESKGESKIGGQDHMSQKTDFDNLKNMKN